MRPVAGQQELQQKAGKRKRRSNGSKNRSNTHIDGTENGEGGAGNNVRDNFGDNNLGAIFGRVVKRRQKEVTILGPALVRVLLMEIRELTGNGLPSLIAAPSNTAVDTKAASKDIRGLIENEYNTIRDESALPDKRRRSWDVVNKIFRLIDDLTGGDDEDEREATIPSVATNGKDSHPTGGKKAQLMGKTNNSNSNSNNRKGINNSNISESTAAAFVPPSASASSSSATANQPTNPTTQKSTVPVAPTLSTTEKKGGKSLDKPSRAKQTNTTTATNNNNKNNKAPRTVASLLSASVSTIATAMSSTANKASTHNGKNPPVHPSTIRGSPSTSPSHTAATLPVGQMPPPYKKRSATTQQHKAQRQLQLQPQRKHPKANIHPSSRELLRVNSNSNSNNKTQPAARSAAIIPGKNGVANSNASNISRNVSTGAAVAATRINASISPTASQPSAVARDVSGSFSSSSTNSSTTPQSAPPQAKALNIQFTPSSQKYSPVLATLEKPIPTSEISRINLPADDSAQKPTAYGCFVENRPQVVLEFKQHTPTKNMTEQFMRRLNKWDPYWNIEKNLCVGLTAPVIHRRWVRKADKIPKFSPNMAATFTIKDLLKAVGPRIRNIDKGQPRRDGDLRVLIRMLPFDLSKQAYGGKKRADFHIWPKGTYLQIHAAPSNHTNPQPLQLRQRKQQSHDDSKWLGICDHLDITSLLHNAWASTTTSLNAFPYSTVQIGCYDPELYFFNLALCRYRAPQTVSKILLYPLTISRDPLMVVPKLKRASYEEMCARAKRMMESNEVMLLDDSDEDEGQNKSKTPEELRRILLSVQDPFTISALKVPVRGPKCLHVSCFDLNSFLEMNKSASGQRWKCGWCENFISYEDLEHCALSEQAVKLFGNEISNLQHMVEFKEDKSISLCKPVKSHQERTKAKKVTAARVVTNNGNIKFKGNPDANGGGGNDVVELLDSDSD